MRVVTLYGRPGCHLCEEVRRVILAVARRTPLRLDEVNVDGDPALRAEYDAEVPVTEVDGREVSRYRLTEEQLLRALG